jgi:HAD superfamily hydrolase (TIGR01484 family)
VQRLITLHMKNIETITYAECARIRGILFDIDDTFTHEGKMLPAAFQALWDLHEACLITVPLTGRPAGWCDHFARMWPVDGVVGENGAFYFYYDREAGKLRQRYIFTPEQIAHRRGELAAIKDEVLRRVPAAGVSADQPFRLFDLAIDFREDVSPLSEGEIDEICRVFAEHHATHKISSIHVNGWFGDYNKLSTARLFLEERFSMNREEAARSMLFAGDSPNDEPMFEALDLTVGVANIKHFSAKMKHLPKYVTGKSGGYGFAEMARIILEKRNQA